MKLAVFDATTARIGCDDDPLAREAPAHDAYLSPFGIARCCVTAAEYFEFITDPQGAFHPYWCDYIDPCFIVRVHSGFELRPGTGLFPMVQVSYWGCVAYCNWLSAREGLESVYDLEHDRGDISRGGYRLPTEAEWEHVCRAGLGESRRLPPDDAGWCNYRGTDPSRVPGRASRTKLGGFAYPEWSPVQVGTLPADDLGLHELLGNVREWCHDFYQPYPREPQRDPSGPARGMYRVTRGGSFLDPAELVQPHVRAAVHQNNKCMQYGFRVAKAMR